MSAHPDNLKSEVKALVTNAAERLFSSTDWKPRIIRHNKSIGESGLEFIDYALPCFELAKLTGQNPVKVADKIAAAINKSDKTNKYKLKTEALSGYVNFMLDDNELMDEIRLAAKWYAKPAPLLADGLKIEFLVVGINISETPRVNTTDKAYEYLNQVFSLIGVDGHSTYMIGDFSREISGKLVSHLSPYDSSSFGELTAINRQVRSYLSNREPDEKSPINKLHKSLSGKWVHDRLLAEHQSNLINRTLLYESEISKKVHAYLDTAEMVQHDKTSSSAWIELNDDVVPLRSSDGALFNNAYLLYALSDYFKKVNGSKKTRLIVVGSHRLSLIISSQLSWLVKKSKPAYANRATYFDPRVSRANILEVTEQAPDLKAYMQATADVLQGLAKEHLSDPDRRHSALVLVDTPYDLAEFIKTNQYPGVFDAISQMCDARLKLSA